MNDNFTNTTLLIRYMDQELSPEELASIEENLATDKNLQAELENLKNTRLSISGLGLREQVARVHGEMMQEMKEVSKPLGKVRSIARLSMRIAAGIIVLIIAGASYQYFVITPERLFNENYNTYTIGSSRAAGDISPLEKAFRQKDFITTIALFKTISNPDPRDYFLAGNAYLETGDLSNAILQFNNCLATNQVFQTPAYLEDAEYYLAITYLKNKEINKALPLFEKIHEQPLHLYHDKVNNWFINKVKVARWKQ
jgi:tetratricopeptide (TPR) repeat protein